MKKIIMLLVLVIVLSSPSFFTSCQSNEGEVIIKTEFQYYDNNTKLIKVYWNNESMKPITFGYNFFLQQEVEGAWVEITDQVGDFPRVLYVLQPKSETSIDYNVSYHEELFEDGYYRLFVSYTSDNKVYNDYVYFTIIGTPFPETPIGDLVDKYLLTFDCYIYNDYMPTVVEDESDRHSSSYNSLTIITSRPWPYIYPHPFYSKLQVFVKIVTTSKTIISPFISYNNTMQYSSVDSFSLNDEEEYTMYVTLCFLNEKQTIVLHGVVDTTH